MSKYLGISEGEDFTHTYNREHIHSSECPTSATWFDLYGMLMAVDESRRNVLLAFHRKYNDRFLECYGSQSNHQAWRGGYTDHVIETMRIASAMYWSLFRFREAGFTLGSVLVVLFLHDIEKLFPQRIQEEVGKGLSRPEAKDRVKFDVLHEECLWSMLDDDEKNALDHIEGEKDYDGETRKMRPLAAFCHACDILSARMWHDRPLANEETLGKRYAKTF